MISTHNRQRINTALNAFETDLTVTRMALYGPEKTKIVVSAIRDAATKLEQLAKELRELYVHNSDWRFGAVVIDKKLAIGQAYASLLNNYKTLSDEVVDVIEVSYGVRFNTLALLNEAVENKTGIVAFVAFDGRAFSYENDNITLFYQGQYKFTKVNDFKEKFTDRK